jgi:hypothetical protein
MKQYVPNEDGSGRCRPDYEGRRVVLKGYDEGALGLEISMSNSSVLLATPRAIHIRVIK